MATKVVVAGSSGVTASQLKDLMRQIEDGSVTGERLQAFLDRKEDERQAAKGMETESQVARWRVLLKECFEIELEADLQIPERPAGFDRLLIVPKGLKLNRTVEVMRKRFGVWCYNEDLDAVITRNDRTNDDKTYAIWVRDRVEADEELKNLSADDLKHQGTGGVTLLERLLHELVYHSETGKHLDIKNVTLCSGSRHSDGSVRHVSWSSDNPDVYVYWDSPDSRHDHLRTRAVSLPIEALAKAG